MKIGSLHISKLWQNIRNPRGRFVCIPSFKPNYNLHRMKTRYPFSKGTDAMQQQWSLKFMYTFPPFSLIARLFYKVIFDQTKNMILITPMWHTQALYPRLLLRLMTRLILLSKETNITA